MPSANEVEFIRKSPVSAAAPAGLESMDNDGARRAAAPRPAEEARTTPEQKARANDLFVRGALTPEELAKARASRGGFETIVGRSNFLPAVFLEIGDGVSRSTFLI